MFKVYINSITIFYFTYWLFCCILSKRGVYSMQNTQLFSKDNSKKIFINGMKDGFPIGLAYLAVGFTMGIAVNNAGLSIFQGFFTSLFTYASAGQFAGFNAIQDKASLLEIAIVTIVINARYLLMSCALGQKLAPGTGLRKRLLTGATITDELFSLFIARQGYIDLRYNFGAFSTSVPLWALGTALGTFMGEVLPERVVSALSVALYGMFLAAIIAPTKTNRNVAIVVVSSFLLSFLSQYLPLLSSLDGGHKIILLTLLIAGAAAKLAPVKNMKKEEE